MWIEKIDNSNFSRIEGSLSQNAWFYLWATAALKHNIIHKWVPEEQINSFEVFPGFVVKEKKQELKYKGTTREYLKDVEISQTRMSPTHYTPDSIIYWNPVFLGILFSDVDGTEKTPFYAQMYKGNWVSIIDVKAPKGVYMTSEIPFRFTRRMLYMVHGLYVNKIMNFPPKWQDTGYLFKETFTPDRFFYTDANKSLRSIPYQTMTCEQFIDMHGLTGKLEGPKEPITELHHNER